MVTIGKKVEGDYVVKEDTLLSGMITGTVTVSSYCKLKVTWMVCQDAVVEFKGSVEVNGAVCRNVYNNGGLLNIIGTVNGNVYKQSGDTFIDDKAVIKRHVVENFK